VGTALSKPLHQSSDAICTHQAETSGNFSFTKAAILEATTTMGAEVISFYTDKSIIDFK
jgi:hypothetical protein